MMRLAHKHTRCQPVCSSEGWACVENKLFDDKSREFSRVWHRVTMKLFVPCGIDSETSSLEVYWRLSEQTRHKNSSMPISTTLSAWTQLKSSVRFPKWIDDGRAQRKNGRKRAQEKWEINFSVKYPSILGQDCKKNHRSQSRGFTRRLIEFERRFDKSKRHSVTLDKLWAIKGTAEGVSKVVPRASLSVFEASITHLHRFGCVSNYFTAVAWIISMPCFVDCRRHRFFVFLGRLIEEGVGWNLGFEGNYGMPTFILVLKGRN